MNTALALFLVLFADLVPWGSPEGVLRLERSRHKAPFFVLANQFESQANGAFCGVATSTIVMNAVSGRQEKLAGRHTQENFFTQATDKVKIRDEIMGKPKTGKPDPGMQLRQLAALLGAHGLKSEIHVADGQATEKGVRTDLLQAIDTPGRFVIINYHRPELGQTGGGHISPLGAYDEASDSFLVLDVNPNHAPWVWVTTAELLKAMQTKDSAENRGYLLVGGTPAPVESASKP